MKFQRFRLKNFFILCDGCVYHVIVESFYGCPLCRPDDYKEIKGECIKKSSNETPQYFLILGINNEQKIHFIPSAHCVISGAQMHEQISQCFVVSQNVVVALLLAIFLIIMLTVVICVIYQRNKRFPYFELLFLIWYPIKLRIILKMLRIEIRIRYLNFRIHIFC